MRGQRLLFPILLSSLTLASGCGPESRAADAIPTQRKTMRAAQRVQVASVERSAMGGLADVAGLTVAFRQATVASEASARVIERHVEPGAAVAKDDPLVSLDDTLLSIAVDEARATLAARDVDLAEARRELERGDQLRRQDVLSLQRHDAQGFSVRRSESARALAAAALRRAERALADAVVRAPFDGTVESISVQVGDYLAPGTPVANVADLARVRLRAGVTATEAAEFAPGLTARVSLPALGGQAIEAEIRSVGRIADPNAGTYAVELWLDNSDGRIRAGMVGQLTLAESGGVSAAVVPRAAVVRRDGLLIVFRAEGEGDTLRAIAQPVRVGRGRGERVEILEGLEVGQRVVVAGHFALADGGPILVDGNAPPARRGED